LAEMIRDNPSADSLKLEDISLEIFTLILDFLYKDAVPVGGDNLTEIYAAAGKLNIRELMDVVGQKLVDNLTDQNAFEMLMLGKRFRNEELRRRAFEEIQKMLPDKKLSEDVLEQPEKIKKLMEIKRKMDEEFERIKGEEEEKRAE
jgi:BTB/POZ domain